MRFCRKALSVTALKKRSRKGFLFAKMKNKTDIWMPLYIGDYLADTSRLTTEQHGAYFLLMMDYWRNGAPPDNDQILSSICRCSPNSWAQIRNALKGFFNIANGIWSHSRIEMERERAAKNNEARSESGKIGAAKRWQNDSERIANALANTCQIDAPSPSPSPSPSPLPSSSTPPKPVASGKPDANPQNVETWKAYKTAYSIRYGVDPVRNKTVNSQIKAFVERLGVESPQVAAHYVRSNTAFYVRSKHGTGPMLKDAEGLRTEWATGKTVTQTAAMQADKTETRGNVWKDLIQEVKDGTFAIPG
jgi:uncharacterized protein YdaU (DUF1376 family)